LIHNTFLVRPSKRKILASKQYWPVKVTIDEIMEFLSTRTELGGTGGTMTNIALILGDSKFMAAECIKDLLLVFVADKGEDDHTLQERLSDGARAVKKILEVKGLGALTSEFGKAIETSVITRLKIALVGEGGVGKTTTLHLLLGDTPPLQYVPTIALNLETVENIRFGSYSLVIWDFAGQERFRTLWRFYFHGADVIFLVCDSTLRNVIISKDILKLIRRDAPKVPVFAIANKQDKPNAMKPEVVQKILGIPTYPMVAIDKAKRDEMLRILMSAAAQYVGIALPDLPASELLRFATEAAEAAKAAYETAEEGEEAEAESDEEVEVVEEVLVDEDGRVIEDGEDFEIIEEVIEEVDEEGEELTEPKAKPPEEVAAAEPEVVSEGTPDSEISIDIELDEKAGDGSEMAREIISQRLGEDDIISAELKEVSPAELDKALDALSCDEVLPPNGVVESPHTVETEAKSELGRILSHGDVPFYDPEVYLEPVGPERPKGSKEPPKKGKDDKAKA